MTIILTSKCNTGVILEKLWSYHMNSPQLLMLEMIQICLQILYLFFPLLLSLLLLCRTLAQIITNWNFQEYEKCRGKSYYLISSSLQILQRTLSIHQSEQKLGHHHLPLLAPHAPALVTSYLNNTMKDQFE